MACTAEEGSRLGDGPPRAPDAPEAAAAGAIVEGELLVRTARADALHAYGDPEPTGVPGWWRLRLPAGADAAKVEADLVAAGVGRVQYNLRYTPDLRPDDPDFSLQYAHRAARAELGWDIRTDAGDVVVAVIGAGAARHPDLVRNLWLNADEIPGNGVDDDANGYVDDRFGWNFAEEISDPSPPPLDDHETAVACVIAAEANNGRGVAGVAWTAQVMNLRVFYRSDDVAEAIRYAVDNGARVVNMSFGSYVTNKYGPDGIVGEALAYAEANDVVLVATAGNDGIERLRFPAAYDSVVAVSALRNGGQLARFSNHGAWISVAAPGEAIRSCTNTDYGNVSGTSFAAPYVAGVAALVRAEHPSWSAAEVRYVLESSGPLAMTSPAAGERTIDLPAALEATGFPAAYARVRRPYDGEVVRPAGTLAVTGTALGGEYIVRFDGRQGAPQRGPVYDGPLGSFDLSRVLPGRYALVLEVAGGAARHEVEVRVEGGTLPGFPRALDGRVERMMTADLDADGDLELVAATNRGLLVALHHDGTLLPGFPRPVGGQDIGHIALADLDGDGDIEIVVGSRPLPPTSARAGGFETLHHDGRPFVGLTHSTPGPMYSGPVLADVDADGGLEAVYASTDGDVLTLWTVEIGGTPERVVDVDISNDIGLPYWFGEPESLVVANFDADPALEIGLGTKRVYLVDDGRVRPGWPLEASAHRLAAADLDGDGPAELIVAAAGGILALDAAGQDLPGWPQRAGAENNRIAVGDVDGDGVPEVVTYDNRGNVFLHYADARATPGWPKRVEGNQRGHAPVLADLDADGRADILVASSVRGDGLYAWRSDGDFVSGYPRDLGVPLRGTPVLGDFDGNDRLDAFVAVNMNGSELTATDLGTLGGALRIGWLHPRGDAHATGYAPRPLTVTARAPAEGTLELVVQPATDIPAPAAYQVYRDDVPVARVTTSTWRDEGLDRRPRRYTVVAFDETGNPRARSLPLELAWPEVFCVGRADGAACDDGAACTVDDRCQAGACVGRSNEGAACDDGNACTRRDVCRNSACVGEDAVVCESAPCLRRFCQPSTGTCAEVELESGTACDDGDPCTEGDACADGACRAVPVRCASGDAQCGSRGVCDPATGACTAPQAPDGTDCDDGLACTTNDRCRGGVCGGSAVTCQPISGCRVQPICSEAEGQCVRPDECRVISDGLGTTEEGGCGCTAAENPEGGAPWAWLGTLAMAMARLSARSRRRGRSSCGRCRR